MSALAVATGPADRETEDLDLVAAVRAGDDRAFEVLFRRYQPRVAAYVGGMVRDHGRAEDITQEVFMSALRRLRTDDEREILFRPWIYEIAKNKCIDAYRRGRHTNEVSLDAHDQVGVAEHGRLAEPSATPDAAVESKLAFDSLRGAFGDLSPVHHDILVMREFEGLSYREIGERLDMTRPAVESTLFRARKRLGEEYDELVSGKRCLRVQAILEEGGVRAAGVRDQRRVARHLAHCQPCRRHAHLAGADVDLLRPVPSRAARVAALLPLPAFLRRRWGGEGEPTTQILGVQMSRPAAQMTAHLAGTVDPGMASGWAKLAATAATVALAGVGGAAIEHRAPERPAKAGEASPAADQPRSARSARPRRVAPGAPLPAQVAATRAPAGAGAPGAGQSATGANSSQAPAGSRSKPAVNVPLVDPQGTVGALPQPPLGSVDDTTGGALAPLLDAVGGAGRDAGSSLGTGGGSQDGNTGLRPGQVLGGALAPAYGAAGSTAVGDVAGGADGAVGGARDALRAPAGAGAASAAPTGQGASVLPSVSDTLKNPSAAPPSLGG